MSGGAIVPHCSLYARKGLQESAGGGRRIRSVPLEPILQGLLRISTTLRNLNDGPEIPSGEATNVAGSASSHARSKLAVRLGEATICAERFPVETFATVVADGQ
jgi:hypothetical protein